uniref:Putative ovule protein n=1 Tax=Solanum chacoense TaxID=4108 RepID=A0A0V0H4C3_SOLCH
MPRTRPAIHMGYSAIQKGYILLDLTTKVFLLAEMFCLEKTCFPLHMINILKDTNYSQIYSMTVQLSIFKSCLSQLMYLIILSLKVLNLPFQIRSLSNLEIQNLASICLRIQLIT